MSGSLHSIHTIFGSFQAMDDEPKTIHLNISYKDVKLVKSNKFCDKYFNLSARHGKTRFLPRFYETVRVSFGAKRVLHQNL